ncbi:MAG: FAD-dependent oxidoreductase, partial [Clostridia bacterium]
DEGAKVAVFEREKELGGILNQCIHNGFGLHYFKEELTGPEYAERFIALVDKKPNISVFLEATVLEISKDKKVTALSPSKGLMVVEAGAVVLAMGCRERTAGAIQLLGSRPAGVYTAGMAQKLCNSKGWLVGRKVLILGSGDIGLIMARRMTFEGATVVRTLELMPYSAGLKRNIVQCLNDNDIPLSTSYTITRVMGKRRVEGAYVAPVDEKLQPIFEKEEFIECDTILLSVGLIPENDLISGSDIILNPVTGGAEVDEYRMTSQDGVFSAGNVLHVNDLVDNVSEEAATAGTYAAQYALGRLPKREKVLNVKPGKGLRYALPQKIAYSTGKTDIYFRTDAEYRGARLTAMSGDEKLFSRKYMILVPGEMGKITVDTTGLNADITLSLEV